MIKTFLNEQIGENLRRERRELGWSLQRLQGELEKMGYSTTLQRISLWETNQSAIPAEVIAWAACVMDVPIQDFFYYRK